MIDKKILAIIFISLSSSNIILASALNVLDGDTIKHNGVKIRFSGIDAPLKKE